MEGPAPSDAIAAQATPAVPASVACASTALTPVHDFARTWVRRYFQSNLVALLFTAFVFFFLLRDELSLIHRVGAAAVALVCWQGLFAACLLGRRRFPRLWPAARNTAIVLFVGWQLFFLFVRNPLDFWYDSIRKWCQDQQVWDGRVGPVLDPVDDATRHYGNFNGIDQDWRMFTPPLSRRAAFLAARIEFTDGGDDLLLSENEPDPQRFFRFGGWRQRKLEDRIAYKAPDDLPHDEELPLCAAYVRWSLRRWREAHPDDPRMPARVVLLRRSVPFDGADDSSSVETAAVGVFLPDGSLAP